MHKKAPEFTADDFLRFKARMYLKRTALADLALDLRVLKRSPRPLTLKEAKKVLAYVGK